MDLELHGPEPTEDERAAIDAAIGPPVDDARSVVGVAEAARRRPLLLPALHAAQARVGWVSPGALAYVARRLHVPPAEAYGVASFYALYALHPRARSVAHVCDDIGCKARGADALCDELGARLGPAGSQHGGAGWMRSPCLGLCEQAPVALIQHAGAPAREGALGEATADRIVQALGETDRTPEAAPAVVHQDRASLTLLARVGLVDPTSLDDYRARGGYRALRRALDRGGASVLHELSVAKLAGRGGAAFPTARKWQAVAAQPARPHYVVCNADESEPGTFKDRVLMEQDPFAVIEGVTLAAFATASEKAYLYVRAEYPLAAARLQNAIDLARSRGFLGDDVLGRGVKVDIEIRRGAGAYICGEETALLSSIEGHRGEPRNKPPFPVEIGLFGKPTAINNVETLCAAVAIVADGGAAWAAVGTPDSTGTRLFCVSGHVGRPGVYELPMGERLSTLLDLARAERVSAVLLGGAAGAFLGPGELDVPLSFEGTRAIGATLGSGVVMVLREGTELLPYLRRMAAFFRDESCGQCVPCRVGTVRVEELLARAALRGPNADDRALLADLSQVMRDASICGLGQTATSALDSAVKRRLALVDGGAS
ncbi:MAG: NAD(P)H-dependent oxidoreductase subunit E [Myxococcales bacterium]|nr:NAD(P)H-dependent oxidoreductase subunit E [Myxococcales bacterium]